MSVPKSRRLAGRHPLHLGERNKLSWVWQRDLQVKELRPFSQQHALWHALLELAIVTSLLLKVAPLAQVRAGALVLCH